MALTPRSCSVLLRHVAGPTRWGWVCTADFHASPPSRQAQSYKLVIVGGGSGGCAMANKFVNKMGPGQVAIIEPSAEHYYQPLWTLVGAGVKTFDQSYRPLKSILPKKVDWIQDRLGEVDPEACTVTTEGGKQLKYEYLIIAMGIQVNLDQVKGLPEAMESDPRVACNYVPQYVSKTYGALQAFEGGNAIFTFPATPIKCAGAPQKIMYMADSIFRRDGKRDKANIIYNTALPVIFGVKKYAAMLNEVVKEKNITVNYRWNLVEVKPDRSEAVFANLDSETGETRTDEYSFLHVGPPCGPPDVLKKHKSLTDQVGFLEVDKHTLQHVRYPNIFGIGDCTNVPTAKTAAAVAAQSGILRKNLTALMKNGNLPAKYDGYTSCPLLTHHNRCILAEFDFDGQPLETFPINQGKERRSMWMIKANILPHIYWHFLVKGWWEGPEIVRKLLHLGMSR